MARKQKRLSKARLKASSKSRRSFKGSRHSRHIVNHDRANRVAQAIRRMRTDGVSLRQAARELRIDPRAVVRLGSSALLKLDNGRYIAKDYDRISRLLLMPTENGLREIAVPDSRQASKLAKYWDAVQKYLETGDSSGLAQFEGKHIKGAVRERVPLLTNLNDLDRLGSAGVLSFESVYARTA